jgi:hypothetical protein
MKRVLVLSLASLAVFIQELAAEEVVLNDWDSFTQPTLINSDRPKIPGAMFSQDLEGWVDVVVTVAVDGTAYNPRITNTSIPGIFNKTTLEATKKWHFEPATINGRPVETTFEARQVFYFRDNHDAVSEAFFRRARGISRALAKGDLATALKKIEQLDEKRQRLLAEGVYMDFFKATYFEKAGDTQSALLHVNRALGIGSSYVTKPVREHLLRSAVTLDAAQLNFASVLSRFEELETLIGKLPADDPVVLQLENVQSVIRSDAPLERVAVLERCPDCDQVTYSWSHTLVRNRFTVPDVPASLEETQLRCGSRFQKFRLRSGDSYQIPEFESGCYFHTESWQPVSFSFIELPAPVKSDPANPAHVAGYQEGARGAARG